MDAQAGRRSPACVERAKRVQEQRLAEAAASPGPADGERLDPAEPGSPARSGSQTGHRRPLVVGIGGEPERGRAASRPSAQRRPLLERRRPEVVPVRERLPEQRMNARAPRPRARCARATPSGQSGSGVASSSATSISSDARNGEKPRVAKNVDEAFARSATRARRRRSKAVLASTLLAPSRGAHRPNPRSRAVQSTESRSTSTMHVGVADDASVPLERRGSRAATSNVGFANHDRTSSASTERRSAKSAAIASASSSVGARRRSVDELSERLRKQRRGRAARGSAPGSQDSRRAG